MSDLWHFGDTGIALWHVGTHSPHCPYIGCGRYPKNYKRTLKGIKWTKKIYIYIWFYIFFVCVFEHISHSCNCVGKHLQSSRSCRCRMWGLRCCTGTSCTRQCVCHTQPCQSCRCYYCTDMVGSAQRAERGYHGNLEHTPHIDPLKQVEIHKFMFATSYCQGFISN